MYCVNGSMEMVMYCVYLQEASRLESLWFFGASCLSNVIFVRLPRGNKLLLLPNFQEDTNIVRTATNRMTIFELSRLQRSY